MSALCPSAATTHHAAKKAVGVVGRSAALSGTEVAKAAVAQVVAVSAAARLMIY
jgi:hypothetical protein